jgi:carbon monoxide dehydrogenase subunit G
MPFQIEKTFVVRAPAQAVWDFLTDPPRVARCMPGAAVTDRVDDRTWSGTLTVKVGPVLASYKGRMSFARLDAQERAAEIVASGQDVRGKGGATMRLRSRVSERGPAETEVVASSEVNVTGLLAQMGRGMVQDIGDQIFVKFTDAMRAELEEAAASAAPAGGSAPSAREAGRVAEPRAVTAPPLDVLSLGASAATRAAARSAQRPQVWIALAILVVLALWLFVRARS